MIKLHNKNNPFIPQIKGIINRILKYSVTNSEIAPSFFSTVIKILSNDCVDKLDYNARGRYNVFELEHGIPEKRAIIKTVIKIRDKARENFYFEGIESALLFISFYDFLIEGFEKDKNIITDRLKRSLINLILHDYNIEDWENSFIYKFELLCVNSTLNISEETPHGGVVTNKISIETTVPLITLLPMSDFDKTFINNLGYLKLSGSNCIIGSLFYNLEYDSENETDFRYHILIRHSILNITNVVTTNLHEDLQVLQTRINSKLATTPYKIFAKNSR